MQSTLEEDYVAIEDSAPFTVDAEDEAMARDVSREIAAQLKTALPSAIEAAFQAREPKGRFSWIKKNILNLGVVGTLLTVILWLSSNCLTFYRDANNRLADQKQFEQKTNDKLEAIEKTLTEMKGQLLAGTIQRLTVEPISQNSIASLEKTIGSAKIQNVRLDPSDLRFAGQHLLSASQKSPEAWQAAQVLMSYRSFINSDVTANLNKFTVPTRTTFNIIPRPENLTGGSFDLLGPATKVDQAELVELDYSGKATGEYGPSWVKIDGGTLKLDGLSFRKVVIKDAVIQYDGGPLSLTNVFFVNCRFEMPLRKNTEMLANSVFSVEAGINLRAT